MARPLRVASSPRPRSSWSCRPRSSSSVRSSSGATRGVGLEYRTYEGVDHFALRTVAAGDVVGWLLDRVAAHAAPAGCSTAAG